MKAKALKGDVLLNTKILNVEHLKKSFGKTEILHDVNLTVYKGEVYGLVGQNGAGKTTLLRLVMGLMKPTFGSITIQTNKSFIGYMPQTCRFDDVSTVAKTISFFVDLRKANYESSLMLCNRMDLDITKKVKYLSPGQQKKLQLVIAMTGNPDLYILDEPTAGLDPNATFEMLKIIQSIHEEGKSIIISSHILQDMDEICTNVVIMEKGSLIYNKELENCYVIKTDTIPQDVLENLAKHYSFTNNERNNILYVKADKYGVSNFVKELTLYSVGIFEVTASNVKTIVKEQMHMGGSVN